jgi:hypothetical protein
MTAEHVGALNLIEIEFASDLEVQSAWKKLFEHLADEHPRQLRTSVTNVSVMKHFIEDWQTSGQGSYLNFCMQWLKR